MERKTRQGKAVRHALGEARRPVSPGELLHATRRTVSTIGIATIYRHLREMLRDGHAVAVKLPGGQVCYETADKTHHHHFVCDSCERVFEVPGCPPGLRALAPEGFTVDRHEVILYGQCSRCAGESRCPGSSPRRRDPGGARVRKARSTED